MTTPTPEHIRAFREAAGLSRPKFAALVGCSWQAVKEWEYGNKTPTGLYLKALQKAMHHRNTPTTP